MKALHINDYAAPLQLDEAPVPSPAADQVLVENHFTSMNGVDPGAAWAICARSFNCSFPGLLAAMSLEGLQPWVRA